MIQAAFASLGDGQDRPIGNDDSNVYWNMYTAPAWLSVMLSLINIVVLMPFIFTEFNIAKEEGDFLAARGLEKSSTAEEEDMGYCSGHGHMHGYAHDRLHRHHCHDSI